MKVLKGLVLSLLSLLLFLSLSVFGIVFTLNSTLLNADFVAREIDKIDMPAVTKELTDTLIVPMLPQELRFLREPIYGAVADFSPALKDQLKAGIHSSYDYFLGKTPRLSLVISLEPLKTNLRDRARQAFQQNLPPQLAGQPPAQVDQYFNQFYQQYAQQIPSSLTLDEATIGQQTMSTVRQVRQYVGYVQIAYWGLIAFMVLLVLGIILINRNVRSVSRELGVNFLIYGGLEYAGIIIGKMFLPTTLPVPDIPPSLQSWLSQVAVDLMAPLEMFSLILVAIGVVLIVVSFVYKPRTAQTQ